MIIYYVTHIISWIIVKIVFRIKAYGVENIPYKGAILIASNHVSNMDPIFIPIPVWRRKFNFMAKEELFCNPIINAYFRRLKMFPVKRGGKGDLTAIKKFIELIRQGELLLMFPEGTRSETGELLPAKPGVAMIALKTNTQIIPTYIHGSRDVLPKGAKMIRPKKVSIYFGKPFSLEKFNDLPDNKEKYEKASEEIMKKIAELRDSVIKK